MYVLKGFITSQIFVDNTVGTVSKIGEISKNSLTYAIETGIYSKVAFPDTTLYSFRSTDGDVKVEVPSNYADILLEMGVFLYRKSLNQEIIDDQDAVRGVLGFEFGNKIFDINLGNMVTDGDYWIPEWVSFKTTNNEDFVKVWFVDDSFANQYDEMEYKVLAPIEDINLFFSNDEVVQAKIEANDVVNLMLRLEEIKAETPYTLLNANKYDWVNPEDETQRISTTWMVMIYGKAGNNLDAIKQELTRWVLANSSYTKEQWMTVLPDLFKVNEFILAPLWHQFAIPNQTVQSGFNSPIVDLAEIGNITDLVCTGLGYEAANAFNNTIVTTAPIRNLAVLATGNSLNKSNVAILRELIPDYINVSLSSLDFTRMTTATQEWVQMFVDLLIVSDKYSDGDVVPSGYQRVKRDGIVYIAKYFRDVYYLMVTKESMINALGIESPYMPEFPDGTMCECSVELVLLQDHILNHSNPHKLTSDAVGLGNIRNTDVIATLININDVATAQVKELLANAQ